MRTKHSPQDFLRGAALVETALVASLIMTLMLGVIRLATIGYLQLSVDAGAYYQAHQLALGGLSNETGAQTYTQSLMPNALSNSGGTTFTVATPQPAPSTNFNGVNYQYTLNGSPNLTNRHGGASVVQGTQIVGQVSRTIPILNSLFGRMALSVSGNAIEPYFQEFGTHYGDAGDPNASTNFSEAQPIFGGSGSGAEDTPPYFIGFHFLLTCARSDREDGNGLRIIYPDNDFFYWNSDGDWKFLGPTACPIGFNYFTTPFSFMQWDAVGLAEFLDQDNWNSSANGLGSNGVFADMTCHQQIYAEIAQNLTTPLQQLHFWPYVPYVGDKYLGGNPNNPSYITQIFTYSDPMSNTPFPQEFAEWDATVAGGMNPPPNPATLNPSGNCAGAVPGPNAWWWWTS
jgi:hypothetical protein